MWKKFCVAILSILLLSGIIVASQPLFASTVSKVTVELAQSRDYYIKEEIPFHVDTQNEAEKILFVSGGNVIGNRDEYTIPLQEDSSNFTLKNITKPGSYQGNIATQVSYSNQNTSSSVTTPFSFILYGKAFQQEQYHMQVNEEISLQTYGTLPDSLKNPTVQYHSIDNSIAQVDEVGHVIARSKGTTSVDVVVLDESGNERSKSSCQIIVSEEVQTEVDLEKAIPAQEYEYRFIEMETLFEEQTKDKVIGSIHLGQSGTHTYYVDKEKEDELQIIDGNIILKKEMKAASYQAVVYARHEASKKLYKIPISYVVHDKKEQAEETAFSFRYNGEDVKHILHAYQAGANNFQISSNQAISDVFFRLKDESDNAYFSISQTGNVSIKKVTEKPVIIQATWKKQTFELPIVIEKAEQVIAQDIQNLIVHKQDGAFEPLITGTQGTGSLVLTSSNADVASISMSKNQRMSIQPNEIGITSIEVYNNGDENYKKSNVLRFQVEVVEDEAITNGLQAQSDWLLYPQAKGDDHWYNEDVLLEINPTIESIADFSYQGKWMKELTVAENGVHNIPITFRDHEDGSESNALMVQLAIDTHAPMITQMSEDRVANNPLKEFINKATFQKAYGTGRKISIQMSDFLVDKQIKVSGVATIDYKIFALEDHQEELLLAGKENVNNDQIELIVDDTRVHKVCATVSDHAGMASEETCTILNGEIATVTSDNSGIVLQGRAFQTNAKLKVEDVLADVLAENVTFDEPVEVHAALKLSMEEEHFSTQEESFDIIIPLRAQDEVLRKGTWKQLQENGNFENVVSTYEKGTFKITTNSLNTLLYVQEIDTSAEKDFQSLSISNEYKQSNDMQPRNIVKNAFQSSNFDMKDIDITLLLYIGGGIVALLFAILLLRANHEEHYE